jgi:hypothetical protein
LIKEHNELIKKATSSVDEVRDIQNRLGLIHEMLESNDTPAEDSIFTDIKTVKKESGLLMEKALGKKVQGIYRKPEVLISMIRSTSYLLDHVLSPATDNQRNQQELLSKSIEEFEKDVNDFKVEHLNPLYEKLKGYDLRVVSE